MYGGQSVAAGSRGAAQVLSIDDLQALAQQALKQQAMDAAAEMCGLTPEQAGSCARF